MLPCRLGKRETDYFFNFRKGQSNRATACLLKFRSKSSVFIAGLHCIFTFLVRLQWVLTISQYSIPHNCEHSITKTEKPQGILRSAATQFRSLNLSSVLECYPDGLILVHRHILDRVAPQSLIELGDECVQFPYPADAFISAVRVSHLASRLAVSPAMRQISSALVSRTLFSVRY